MGAAYGNTNAKKKHTLDDRIGGRVHGKEKRRWIRAASKEGYDDVFPWLIDTLNERANDVLS